MRFPRPIIPTAWYGLPLAVVVIVVCSMVERWRKVRR